MLGAGGAARAVVAGLRRRGARVTVHARRPERGARARGRSSASTPDRGRRPRARGTCWSTRRRSAPSRRSTTRRWPARSLDGRAGLRPGLQPAPDAAAARRAAAGLPTIDGLDDAGRAGARQFAWWTGRAGCRGHARRGRAAAGRDGARARACRRRGVREDARATMNQTTFEEFVELAQRGTFVPVYKELMADLLTPVSAFLKIAEHADYAFLLESVEGGEQVARYSFLGKDPFLVLRRATARRCSSRPARRRRSTSRSSTRSRRDGRVSRRRSCPICRASPAAPSATSATTPRRGSSRRWTACWERQRARLGDDRGRGGVHAVRHGAGVRSRQASHPAHRQRADHARRGSRDAVSVRLRADPVPRARARAQPVAGAGRAAAPSPSCRRAPAARTSRRACARPRSTSPPATSTRWCCRSASTSRSSADPFTVYRALRHVNPSPYMYFLRVGGLADRRLVARDAGARRRPPRRDAPDRRHAAARPHERRGHAARRRAEARREGARRARDARRPRAQRPRARLRVRHACACRST